MVQIAWLLADARACALCYHEPERRKVMS